MPLVISVLPGSSVAIYRQIVDQVSAAILAGKIAPDEPLPSVRGLAEHLVLNPNTVSRAYGELQREGIIESRPGRGMFISERRQIYSRAERTRRLDQATTALVTEALLLGFTPKEILDHVAETARAMDGKTKGKTSTDRGSR